jgi:hypothetical protein
MMVEELRIPVKSKKTAFRMVGEEAVILILDKQQSLVLNETGAFIWENCDGKKTVGEISTGLSRYFDVDADEALEDCRDFIRLMIDKEALSLNNP